MNRDRFGTASPAIPIDMDIATRIPRVPILQSASILCNVNESLQIATPIAIAAVSSPRLTPNAIDVDCRLFMVRSTYTCRFDVSRTVVIRRADAEHHSSVPKGQPYHSPGWRQGESHEPWRNPGLRGQPISFSFHQSESQRDGPNLMRTRSCLGPPRVWLSSGSFRVPRATSALALAHVASALGWNRVVASRLSRCSV